MCFVLFFFHLLLSLTLPFSLLTPLWRGMQMKTVFILYPLLPFLAYFSVLFLPVALKMLKWQNEHIWTFCSCTSFKHHVGENLRLELNSMVERGMRNYSCMRDNLCFSLRGIMWINEWEKWRKWLERRGQRALCSVLLLRCSKTAAPLHWFLATVRVRLSVREGCDTHLIQWRGIAPRMPLGNRISHCQSKTES